MTNTCQKPPIRAPASHGAVSNSQAMPVRRCPSPTKPETGPIASKVSGTTISTTSIGVAKFRSRAGRTLA